MRKTEGYVLLIAEMLSIGLITAIGCWWISSVIESRPIEPAAIDLTLED